MNKLQASMKDASAKRWREDKVHYKIGSYFKGCRNCGVTEWVELPSGKEVERYLTGHNVFRAYDPAWSGYTFYCFDCSAKDLKCWEPDSAGLVEAELGKPPISGTRDVKRERKYALRKELAKLNPKVEVRLQAAVSRAAEIAALQAQIAALEARIKGSK